MGRVSAQQSSPSRRVLAPRANRPAREGGGQKAAGAPHSGSASQIITAVPFERIRVGQEKPPPRGSRSFRLSVEKYQHRSFHVPHATG
jgi:hypothetical protein